MANRKISDLTSLTAPATGDLLPIVDISEAAAADKNKKITFGELLASAPAGSAAAPSFSFDGDPNTGTFNPAADTLAFAGGGVEGMRIDSTGLMTLAGPGIKFPATAVASADPNTLDDYEEGTWTPTVQGDGTAGTASYTIQFGNYTKIGRSVTVNCNISYTGGTGTGYLLIGNLPFTSLTATNLQHIGSCYFFNITTPALNQVFSVLNSNRSSIQFQCFPLGGGSGANIDYDAAGTISLTLTYFTA